MKNLTCEKCNTHLKDFFINQTHINCKCLPDSESKEKGYDICNGVFLFIACNRKIASKIQICYRNIELDFIENDFYFKINNNIIIEGKHNLKFSKKNLINNIEKQLIFLGKQEGNLLFI